MSLEETVKSLGKRLESTEKLIEEMNKRLEVTEEIEEVKKMHYSYINYLMFCKWDEINELFTEDATFDIAGPQGPHSTKGKKAIDKAFKEGIAHTHIGKEGDVLVHPIITVNGNKAKGNWLLYMMYFHPRTYQSLLWVQGIYDCDYVKENGKWKFSYLKFRPRIEPPDGPPNPQYQLPS